MTQNALNGALQENVLTLLCFDTDASKLIANAVDVELFESSVLRRIAERAVRYFKKYKRAPGDHLPDLVEDLRSKGSKEARLYDSTLKNLYALQRSINREYVLSELDKFIRRQVLRQTITKAASFIQEDKIDLAESTLLKGIKRRVETANKGLTLTEVMHKPSILGKVSEVILTGIKELDAGYICPARKELLLVLGRMGTGKTWALTHLGKYAAMQRLRVIHYTLEMAEEKMAMRYLQSFFSLTKRQAGDVQITRIVKDKHGRFTSIEPGKIKNRPAILRDVAKETLWKRGATVKGRMQVLVKQFPTGAATVDMINAHLETLEADDGFIPDMIIIDYADLMKMDPRNVRIETGLLFKDIRGLGVERNASIITASQSNRPGEDAKILTPKHLAEDYSKGGISDIILSFNQTQHEKVLGLGRVYVVKARDEFSGQIVIVSQAYEIGQFCLDSAWMSKGYWEKVDGDSRDHKQKGHRRLPR